MSSLSSIKSSLLSALKEIDHQKQASVLKGKDLFPRKNIQDLIRAKEKLNEEINRINGHISTLQSLEGKLRVQFKKSSFTNLLRSLFGSRSLNRLQHTLVQLQKKLLLQQKAIKKAEVFEKKYRTFQAEQSEKQKQITEIKAKTASHKATLAVLHSLQKETIKAGRTRLQNELKTLKTELSKLRQKQKKAQESLKSPAILKLNTKLQKTAEGPERQKLLEKHTNWLKAYNLQHQALEKQALSLEKKITAREEILKELPKSEENAKLWIDMLEGKLRNEIKEHAELEKKLSQTMRIRFEIMR